MAKLPKKNLLTYFNSEFNINKRYDFINVRYGFVNVRNFYTFNFKKTTF